MQSTRISTIVLPHSAAFLCTLLHLSNPQSGHLVNRCHRHIATRPLIGMYEINSNGEKVFIQLCNSRIQVNKELL